MDRPRDYDTKWNKSEKDKYMISLICGILKNDTNELIYKTEIDWQTGKNSRLLKGKGGEGGINSKFGIKRYTLPPIK